MRQRIRAPAPAGRLALLVGLLFLSTQLSAQTEDPLRLSVRPTDGSVLAELVGVLDGRGIRSSLEAGLPVRLLVVTELWRDRFFDSQEGRYEWRATVRYDPLAESYRLETGDGVTLEATTTEEADNVLSQSLRIPLSPEVPGRYYYLARIEVETLSLSDLDELRRWLRGDLGPAMDRDSEVGSALGRGLRRILVRALGLPIQRFEARTPAFSWER